MGHAQFVGHTDAVRCIVKIPGGDTFASSGNDGCVPFAFRTRETR